MHVSIYSLWLWASVLVEALPSRGNHRRDDVGTFQDPGAVRRPRYRYRYVHKFAFPSTGYTVDLYYAFPGFLMPASILIFSATISSNWLHEGPVELNS